MVADKYDEGEVCALPPPSDTVHVPLSPRVLSKMDVLKEKWGGGGGLITPAL